MLRAVLTSLFMMCSVVLSSCADPEQVHQNRPTPEGAVTSTMPAEISASKYDQAVENDDWQGARLWGARYLAELFPDESADGLRVDPYIFHPYPKDEQAVLGFNTSVLVRTSQRDQARMALARCSARFFTISYTGGEFESAEEFEASLGGAVLGTDDDIPSWVSDPMDRDDGVALVFDSAWMLLPMKVTMINVLRQELRAAGVSEAFITSDPAVSDAP